MPTDNIDEQIGTWINPDYEDRATELGKQVINEDGTVEWYHLIKSGSPSEVYYLDVKEKWMDRKDSVNFKIFVDQGGWGSTNMFIKISSDMSTLEMLEASRMEFLPTQMDPDALYCNYYIWYRQ